MITLDEMYARIWQINSQMRDADVNERIELTKERDDLEAAINELEEQEREPTEPTDPRQQAWE